MLQPLDQIRITLDKDITGKGRTVSALDPIWKENRQFVVYHAPPLDINDSAALDEWTERMKFITEDLQWLLKLSHQKFWCQMVFDDTLHRCLDSYLSSAPRSYDIIYQLPRDQQEIHSILHRLYFMVFLRTATHKESKDCFITAEVFADILYENFLFDIPKLMDLCVLYGGSNGPLVSKMVANVFTQQPKYNEDLEITVTTVIQIFETIMKKCGIRFESGSGSPQKIDPSSRQKNLLNMSEVELNDVIYYLTDTAATLWSFFENYPAAAHIFYRKDFSVTLVSLYESMVPAFNDAFKKRSWNDHSLKVGLKKKLCQIQINLMKTFRQIISHECLLPIMENNDSENLADYVENYMHTMTTILEERRFLGHLECLFPFQDDKDLLLQSSYPVDSTRLQFIEDAIQHAYASYGKNKNRKNPNEEYNPYQEEAGFAAEAAAFEDPSDSYDVGGACAARVTGVELESLISSVKDLLPDLGEGFIELCLEECNYEVEKVINLVLEDKLPPSLQDIDRQSKRMQHPKEDKATLLSERRNVFDDDEFDVFSRDSVDKTKIFRGKKEKIGKNVLDDKSSIAALKPLYDKYGTEMAESIYDQQEGEYDDEYDDTYDSNLIGADDADSADEVMSRRLFTTPRILQDTRSRGRGVESEESEDDEESGAQRPVMFIEDPAKIRERNEQRRQQQQQRNKKKGQRPQGQGQPPPNRDVVGNPKGQGQEKEVVRNRTNKEKHKATRVHHNRKALADKKRKV